MHAKSLQSCLTLCDFMDYAWNSPGQNTGVGSLSLLQGMFPTQGLKPCLLSLLHCQVGSLSLSTTWETPESSKVKVTQSCPTLCDPMNYTFHGILQARILECIAIHFSRKSSQPRDQTQVSLR